MSSLLVSLLLTAALPAQVASPPAAAPDDVAIRRAIHELGDRQFTVRNRASKFLWEQGLAAEPALQQAARESGGEIRRRAEEILRDFQYGILPETQPNVVALIRKFRDGTPQSRQAAFNELLAGKHYTNVTHLIQREADPDIRRSLLDRLFEDAEAVDRFIELDQVAALIDVIGADQDVTWRRITVGRLLFSAKMIERLAERKQLKVITGFLQREQSADVRQSLLLTVFQKADAVAAMIEKDELDFLLSMIAAEKEQAVRDRLLIQFLSSANVPAAIVGQGKLERMLTFLDEQASGDTRSQILQRLVGTSHVVNALLENSGLDGIIALARKEQAPKLRGELLGRLFVSSQLRTHLTRAGEWKKAILLAKDEEHPDARHAYVDMLLQYGIFYSLNPNDGLSELWQVVRDDEDAHWRATALTRLLSTHQVEHFLRGADDIQWLLTQIREGNAEDRSQLLGAAVRSYRLQRLLIQHGHFEELFTLARAEPEASRADLVTRMLSSSDAAEHFNKAHDIELLFKMVSEYETDAARQEYLSGLFRNHWAMEALLKDDHFEKFEALVRGEQNAVDQAILLAEFLRTQPVVERFQQNDQLDSLLRYPLELENADARHEYLQRVLTNQYLLTALVEKDKFDQLRKLAEAESDPQRRSQLLTSFYGMPQVLKIMVDRGEAAATLEFAEGITDENQRRQFVQRMLFNSQTVESLIAAGQFGKLLKLAQSEPHPSWRASQLGNLLRTSAVVKHLSEEGSIRQVLELVAGEEDENARQQLTSYLVGRNEVLAALAGANLIDETLDLVSRVQSGNRERMLAQVCSAPPVLQRLAADQRLRLLLSVADRIQEDSGRATYLTQLYRNSAAMTALLEGGFFDDVLGIAAGEEDPVTRARLLSALMGIESAVRQLAARGQMSLVIDYLEEEENAPARQQFLQLSLSSAAMTAALDRAGRLDKFVDLCRRELTSDNGQNLALGMLAAPAIAARLSEKGLVDEVLGPILETEDSEKLRVALARLLAVETNVALLTAPGRDEKLRELVRNQLAANDRDQLVRDLMGSQAGIAWLATLGEPEWMAAALTNESSDSRHGNMISNLSRSPAALVVLLDAGKLEFLLTQASRASYESRREMQQAELLFTPHALKYFADHDLLDRVARYVDEQPGDGLPRRCLQAVLYSSEGRRIMAEPAVAEYVVRLIEQESEAYQNNFVNIVLSSSDIRQTLAGSDHFAILTRIAKLQPNEGAREAYLRRAWFDPSGRIPYLLRQGQLEAAEQAFREHAADDWGRLRWATWLACSDQLEPRIAAMQQQRQTEPDQVDARLLVYLLRAKGDLEAARKLAEEFDDSGLQQALLVEQAAWMAAAELYAVRPCPLPIPPTGNTPINDQEIERLGLLSAYQRLAGRAQASAATLALVEKLRTTDTQAGTQWHAAETWLLNNHFDDGLRIVRESRHWAAFDLLVHQQRFEEALAIAKMDDDTNLDKAWLQSLPLASQHDDDPLPGRVEAAMKVALLLHTVGQAQRRDDVFALVEQTVREFADADGTTPESTRNVALLWIQLAAGLYRADLHDRAWTVSGEVLFIDSSKPSATQELFGALFPENEREASAIWRLLAELDPADGVAERLAKLAKLMDLHADETDSATAAAFSAVFAAVEARLDRPDPSHDSVLFAALGETCLRHGREELAERCLQRAADAIPGAALALADLLRRQERWGEAAERYYEVWEKDHEQLLALYLSGHALQQTGDADQFEDGARRKRWTDAGALVARPRHRLAVGLLERGLQREGRQQLERLRGLAEPGSWDWNDATRRLAMLIQDEHPAEAATMWTQYTLGNFRTAYQFNNAASYFSVPSIIARLEARAALAAGDPQAAEKALDVAFEASPGDTNLAEELVPAFEAAGQLGEANRLFDRMFAHYAAGCKKFPEAPLLHNNLAWLAARCHRRLDDARAHAETAVRLAPRSASYIDTLAEVHFHLGDRLTAIELSELSLRLAPRDSTLQKQFARFRSTPLPTTAENKAAVNP